MTNTATTTQNRKLFLTTVAVFAIPFLAALTLHKTGLYKTVGTSNRGTLITPPVAIEALELRSTATDLQLTPEQLHRTWWIVYVMPTHCDQTCYNSLYQMRQTHSALGPEQNRVATMLITTSTLESKQKQQLAQEFPQLTITKANTAQLEQWFTATENQPLQQQQTGFIYLVDTMGAVFMYYPTYRDEQQSILKGRDLLKDLQKVLKLSKIG